MGYVDNKNIGGTSTDRVKIASHSLKKKDLNKTNSENTWLRRDMSAAACPQHWLQKPRAPMLIYVAGLVFFCFTL